MARHENLHVNKLRVNSLYDTNNNEVSGIILPNADVTVFDDFTELAGAPNLQYWILNSTGDANDPAVVVTQNGDCRITTSATDNQGSQLVGAKSVKANYGGVFMEARLKIATAITTAAVYVGFSDSSSLEEPMLYATTTLTTTLSDGAGFIYDTDGTVDQWIAASVDTNVDDSVGLLGVAPVADTYQTFRVEISKDGLTVRYFIDGAPVGVSNTAGVTETVALFPLVSVYNRDGSANTVDVDYVLYGHNRA
jgi:hypothetical protein